MSLPQLTKFLSKRAILLGSIVGAIAGIIYVQKSSQNVNAKSKSQSSPIVKFEAFFKEYLKVGRSAFRKIGKSQMALDVLRGGQEILQELQKKARIKNTRAVRLAKRKTAEIVVGLDRRVKRSRMVTPPKKRAARKTRTTAPKKIRTIVRPKKTTRKIVAKKPTRQRKIIRK